MRAADSGAKPAASKTGLEPFDVRADLADRRIAGQTGAIGHSGAGRPCAISAISAQRRTGHCQVVVS